MRLSGLALSRIPLASPAVAQSAIYPEAIYSVSDVVGGDTQIFMILAANPVAADGAAADPRREGVALGE